MNEICCLIKNETTVDDKNFYIIQESESKKEHLIPINQIHTFKNIKPFKKYNFLKEYNTTHNKTYLSIIHPDFKIGQERDLKIIGSFEIDEKTYFELESDYEKPLTVRALNWQNNLQKVKCKVVGYKRGRPRLKNIETGNSEWNIGDIIPFTIKEFSQFTDKSDDIIDCVVLEIPNSTETIDIRTQNWQNQKDWSFKNINCKVIGILGNGLPKLITYDTRHPHFVVGKTYEFIVTGFTDKTSYKGFNYKVINLIDKLNNSFDVLAIPNQENKIKIGETIECKIDNINTRIQLKQVNSKDPFFYEFDEIVEDDSLKKKYFLKHLEKDDEYNLKLKSQYEQESGFWVFTYCNYILTKIKYEESIRRNLSEVLKIIDLHTFFENWILTSGILRAIQDDDERKLTKLKILQIIENNSLEKKAIKAILDFKIPELYERQVNDTNFKEIYYLIKYSDFENINEIELLKFLSSIKSTKNENRYIIKRLINYINRSLEIYKNSLKQEYFILSQNLKSEQKEEIIKYVNWIYIQIYLSGLTDLVVESNILISKFYRFNTLLLNNKADSEKLLLNAFYIISNSTKKHSIPVVLKNNNIEITLSQLEDNPNKFIALNLDEEYFKTKIVQKHYNGFKATIGETEGFLPFQNITDINLKQNKQESLEWETNIDITLYCSKFQYFICKQLDKESKNYYSKNLKRDKKLNRGKIIYGIVKNVTTFDSDNTGVFISTEFGDGLIHQNEITYNKYDYYDLNNIFTKGDKIPLYVLGYNNENLVLGFKQLIGTRFENEYYDILNNYDIDITENLTDEEINSDFRIELEKGFIFEQFAFFKDSIDEKIKYIKFAKAFFSNTKNARSYLLNIYIEYFNSIKKLDSLTQDYTIEKYNDFRNFIIKIKDKVQTKTLENFPESKNLLFFIDILHIFNSKDENDLEIVFNLVQKSIQENDILLKAVAKTVLSNNLILTEIDKDNDDSLNEYTFKNLKRIREYINQGVLSVEESIEDKLEKELKEKKVYWQKRINEDEGEKLEFKATFVTPIPTNDQNRIIEGLEKQLKKEQSEENINKIKSKIEEVKDLSKNVRGIDKIIIHSALKTICAFANTNGGVLLLGVSDDKKIFGLEQDYNSFKKDKDRDGFGKFFDSMIKDYFGDSFSSTLLEKEFLKFPKGDILIVKVKKSTEEVFLLKNEKGTTEESIYVRNLSSSNKLKGVELSKFIKSKYREQIMNNTEIK
ncbi:RNA-binding domain-containing protein [Psychroserpens sp.]|uniref:RNA-binding domain-containing protein n=1 Tax=Psychroserpens sp. TaxID=2020870 RepID=UPI002B276B54|nr:RNA-binding domain-containing protein [Psychroserpens sp.]